MMAICINCDTGMEFRFTRGNRLSDYKCRECGGKFKRAAFIDRIDGENIYEVKTPDGPVRFKEIDHHKFEKLPITIINIGTKKKNVMGIRFFKVFNDISYEDVLSAVKDELGPGPHVIHGWADVTDKQYKK